MARFACGIRGRDARDFVGAPRYKRIRTLRGWLVRSRSALHWDRQFVALQPGSSMALAEDLLGRDAHYDSRWLGNGGIQD